MIGHHLRYSAITAFIVLVLAGCATFPRPSSVTDSLLVMVVGRSAGGVSRPASDVAEIVGPTRITANLAASKDGIMMFRVRPGTYRLASRSIDFRGSPRRRFNGYSNRQVQVPPATVVLFPWKLAAVNPSDTERSATLKPVAPADRRKAATTLADYVRLARWSGRNVSGFAPYSPFTDYVKSSYAIAVSSNPEGAGLLIDGEDWGRTPLSVHLSAGKHYLELSHAGYAKHTAFIDVEGDGTEHFTLEPSSGNSSAPRPGAVAVLELPFKNLGARRYDNLANLLTSSLQAALRKAGVDMMRRAPAADQGDTGGAAGAATKASGGAASGSVALAQPDFAAAEKAGAAAFIAGDYIADDTSILIHAALYDTRTHLVKASVLFNGKGGFDIFDSIDRMSAEFGPSVEKALPDVGQAVVQERVVTPQTASFSSRVSEQDIIRKRNAHRFTLAFGPSLAGVMDNFSSSSGTSTNIVGRYNGPAAGLFAGFDTPIAGNLSLHLATMPTVFSDPSKATKVELPLYFGARYRFSGFMNDVYVGLQGAAHYAPAATVNLTGTSPVTMGPFILLGVNFETGLRIYTYQRISQPSNFVGIGLTLGLFGYRFDVHDLTHPAFYPMEVGLRVVWGTRL